MKKGLLGVLVLLMAAWAVGAQEASVGVAAAKDTANVAADFAESSAGQVNLYAPSEEARSFALATPANPAASAAAAEPAAATPRPKFVFGDRDDYRWQLGVGIEFFRFESSRIYASLVGLNTTVTYFTNDWFAVEGNLVTGFAPEIYDREHVKYFGGGGGVRIGSRRARWEPWGHALVGGRRAPAAADGGRQQDRVDGTGGRRGGLPGECAVVIAGRRRLRVQHLLQPAPERLPGHRRRRLPLLSRSYFCLKG